jgi:predicted ester cyclase
MKFRFRSHSTLGLVQAFYNRIWNDGDTGAADELLAADFIFRGSLGAEMRGRAAFCDYVRMVRSALEPYRCDILECVTEDERAFAKMRFSGTHVGPFRGYAPTGMGVQWLGAALFRVQRPVIAELWVLGDLLALEGELKKNASSR